MHTTLNSLFQPIASLVDVYYFLLGSTSNVCSANHILTQIISKEISFILQVKYGSFFYCFHNYSYIFSYDSLTNLIILLP